MPHVPIHTKEVIQRIREVAALLERLPYQIREIAESKPWPTMEEVLKRLDPSKINFDFQIVISYVTRNWSPEHGMYLGRQIFAVTNRVSAFIHTFEQCQRLSNVVKFEFDRGEGAGFLAHTLLMADIFRQWAAEIESRFFTNVAATTKRKKTPRRRAPKKVTPIMMEAFELSQRGVPLREICATLGRRHGAKAPKSPTTASNWIRAARRELNPRSRSKRIREQIPTDARDRTARRPDELAAD